MNSDKKTLESVADNIRVLCASMVEKAKSGHPGGAMGGADFINVLYSKYLVTDPDDPTWFARDRFFLDPGHMSTMLYATLALTGKYTIAELEQFRQWGSVTPGHPEVDPERGVENTSGPLGQGHTMAVGCAIAERFLAARFGKVVEHKTYAFISDGGIQEEISQGAGRLAGYLGLHNLIMFYDCNDVQLSTNVDAVTREDYAAKYRAWGWSVIEIDGNDADEISKALETAIAETEKPTLIIGHTIMGKGIVKADGSSFEGQCSTHGNPISKSAGGDYEATVRHLGGNPEHPFEIWEASKALYEARNQELRKIVAERREQEHEWAAGNPDRAAVLADFIAGKLPRNRLLCNRAQSRPGHTHRFGQRARCPCRKSAQHDCIKRRPRQLRQDRRVPQENRSTHFRRFLRRFPTRRRSRTHHGSRNERYCPPRRHA